MTRPRTLRVSARPSPALLRACAAFGLSVRRAARARPHDRPAARALARLARPGRLTLLLGPSGSGKTSLLRALAPHLRARRARVITAAPLSHRRARVALIDLIRAPLAERLQTLASAGLAEAMLLGRTLAELSEGERARASLALALWRASRAGARTIVVDEFTSGLDGATARAVAVSLSKWARRHPRVRVIAASSREELGAWLPDATVMRTHIGAPAHVERTGSALAPLPGSPSHAAA